MENKGKGGERKGKGQYVGFRDDPMRAVERLKHLHRPNTIEKHKILLMEILFRYLTITITILVSKES